MPQLRWPSTPAKRLRCYLSGSSKHRDLSRLSLPSDGMELGLRCGLIMCGFIGPSSRTLIEFVQSFHKEILRWLADRWTPAPEGLRCQLEHAVFAEVSKDRGGTISIDPELFCSLAASHQKRLVA